MLQKMKMLIGYGHHMQKNLKILTKQSLLITIHGTILQMITVGSFLLI